jgi:hypothetical protein
MLLSIHHKMHAEVIINVIDYRLVKIKDVV